MNNPWADQPVLTTDKNGNPAVNLLAAKREYDEATAALRDQWVVGAGGYEVPSRDRLNRWTLYVWNPGLGMHGMLDLATDTVVPA